MGDSQQGGEESLRVEGEEVEIGTREGTTTTSLQAQTTPSPAFIRENIEEEWPMPVWCKMFSQTLSSTTRNYFDDLDPKSVDSFEELSQKFLEEFSQQQKYIKDQTEIHKIKRRLNDGLQAFMDRFKLEILKSRGYLCQRNKGKGRGGVKVINMMSFGGYQKRSHEGAELGVTDEIPLPPILRVKVESIKAVIGWILEGSLLPFGDSGPLGNNGRAWQEQDSVNEVCYHEVPIPLQCYPRKNKNEDPRSSRLDNPLDDQVPNGYRGSHSND
nr:reverse transcriptase domain-containing protein [Tanacetum cinerariifolium]GEY22498.1 reverse transcriptase domain-containing protein [Tanacetum cinerariifolium]